MIPDRDTLQKLFPQTDPEYFKDKKDVFTTCKGHKQPFVCPYIKIRNLNEGSDTEDEDVPVRRSLEIGISGTF